MSPVDLSNGNSLDRFHTFIFSNQPSRAPSIYGLKLPCPHDDPRVMIKDGFFDRLAEILEAAVHIQYLNFATSIINPVFDAVAKAATLRELWVFTDVYEQPLRTRLATFRSPLRSLLVDGSEFVGDTISASYLHDHLSHLAPTLEFLDLDEFPIRIPPSSVTTQFTAVRSLKIKTAFNSDSNPLDVLLRLFPRLDNTLDLGQLIGNIKEENYLAFRERSKDAQNRRAWSGLDSLVCDIATAYLLALQCPIRRMDSEVQYSSPHAGLHLADTLRHNCPRQLHVGLPLYGGFGVLDGMFPPEAADKLTHLVVFADSGRPYGCGARRKANAHWDRFTSRLTRSIKHLHLTHLRIVLRSTNYQSAREPPPDGDLMKTPDGIDLSTAAAQIIDEMPALEHLFLTTCGHTYVVPTKKGWPVFRKRTLERWLSTKAWRVDHRERDDVCLSDMGLDSCKELGAEVAERIMSREELHLSLHEEDKVRECGGARKR